MKRHVTFISFSLGIILSFLYNMPAYMLNPLSRALEWKLQFNNTQGTILDGRAQLLFEKDKKLIMLDPQIHWIFKPLSALVGKPIAFVTGETSSSHISLRASTTALIMEPFSWQLNPSLFVILGEPWISLRAQGLVSIDSEQPLICSMHKKTCYGNLSITWHNFVLPGSPLNPLGTYKATVHLTDNEIGVQAKTHSGILYVEGQGHYSVAKGLRFTGEIWPDEKVKDIMSSYMELIGPIKQGTEHREVFLGGTAP